MGMRVDGGDGDGCSWETLIGGGCRLRLEMGGLLLLGRYNRRATKGWRNTRKGRKWSRGGRWIGIVSRPVVLVVEVIERWY